LKTEAINVGTGEDITIHQLAETMGKVIGYEGHIEFDPTKPDGAPRKLMNVSRLRDLGWQAKFKLEQGLAVAYTDFLKR
jgi:GDP-L-fucose synthase